MRQKSRSADAELRDDSMLAVDEEYISSLGARAHSRSFDPNAFQILVRFHGGLSAGQKATFRAAADRWTRVIKGDLPAVTIEGEEIDDLLIFARGEEIDGPGNVLGSAGPTHLRPDEAGQFARLPARGRMRFKADLAQMETSGRLDDVITHEMGHVIGIGIAAVWSKHGYFEGKGGPNPRSTGPLAKIEYGRLLERDSVDVPIENSGQPGTRDSHWRESEFIDELMTGWIGSAGTPLSRVTAACLADIGYVVDMDGADEFSVPHVSAERNILELHCASLWRPEPEILPAESLVRR